MILDRVTITGADSGVKPAELAALARGFPFVEWGVLFSVQRTGEPRYPDWAWVHKLSALPAPFRLSAHLCGRYARAVLEGDSPWHRDAGPLARCFGRVQLNVSNAEAPPSAEAIERMRQTFGGGQLIIQARPDRLTLWRVVAAAGLDPGLLYDSSGGRGHSPTAWPAAEPGAFSGYAGGLGPHNLQSQLQLIERAAGPARVWVDMESGVRDDKDKFDIGKARRALEQAEPWARIPHESKHW